MLYWYLLHPTFLQNQIDHLEKAFKSLGLTVNLDKTKLMVFRKGSYCYRGGNGFYGGSVIEIVNSYKCLGYTLTTKLSMNCAYEEYASKAKGTYENDVVPWIYEYCCIFSTSWWSNQAHAFVCLGSLWYRPSFCNWVSIIVFLLLAKDSRVSETEPGIVWCMAKQGGTFFISILCYLPLGCG